MIKPIDEIPLSLKDKRKSYRQMIRSDIEEAINKRIPNFEFEGDYNYRYLAQYAREEAKHIFNATIYNPAVLITKKLLSEKYKKDYIYCEGWYKYESKYIKIRSMKSEDRIHVYAHIDFDFGEKFTDILLADTDKKYAAQHKEGDNSWQDNGS